MQLHTRNRVFLTFSHFRIGFNMDLVLDKQKFGGCGKMKKVVCENRPRRLVNLFLCSVSHFADVIKWIAHPRMRIESQLQIPSLDDIGHRFRPFQGTNR